MLPASGRRNVLLGILGGLIVGAVAGVAVGGISRHGSTGGRSWEEEVSARTSYAQQGEDLVLRNIFDFIGVAQPTYIDIGAFDPIRSNNTYLFYKTGSRGVLIEPNPELVPKLRKARPADVVLEEGIGAKADDEEVDYYLIDGDGQLNTFSTDQVRLLRAGHHVVRGVIKRKLVSINEVLAEHFPDRAPDLFSTDTEGYDFTILSTLDFSRWRPRVICVETLRGLAVEGEILDLMKARGYVLRGATFVNSIFIDEQVLRARETASASSEALGPRSGTGGD
jgi:FkbM family methyltransferase